MSDEYSVLLVRILRGEESLATAFWVTLIVLIAFMLYDYYAPNLSDVYEAHFKFIRVAIITYVAVSIHNSCGAAGTFVRYISRTYVVALMIFAAFTINKYYGIGWVVAYPFITALTIYFVKSDY